jgi:hypothetical protein
MKRLYRFLAVAAAAVALLSVGQDSAAQIRLSSHLGLNFDGTDLLIGAGAHFNVDVGSTQIMGNPSADFYLFSDDITVGTPGETSSVDVSTYRINLDVLYPFNLGSNNLDPFIGAGFAIILESLDLQGTPLEGLDESDTNLGLNLRLGTFLGNPDAAFRPFVDAAITISGDTDFAVRAGATFRITN